MDSKMMPQRDNPSVVYENPAKGAVERYEAWKDETYGKKYQINGETFTLADGTVIPVWRRTKTPGPKDVPFVEAGK